MNTISHNSVRLAEGLVKLGQSSASAYRRTLNDSYQLQACYPVDDNRPIDVVGRAIASVDDIDATDILIDDKLSVVDVSRKKFGTGWAITANDDYINVYVNDLFSHHAVTLRIESSIVVEGAALLRDNGLESGRLFYATPSREFRFSVFCPLAEVYSTQDLLAKTQVEFCVRIPKFVDEYVNSFIGMRRYQNTKSFHSPAARHDTNGWERDIDPSDEIKKGEHLSIDFATHSTFDALKTVSATSTHELPLPVGPSLRDDVAESYESHDIETKTFAKADSSSSRLEAGTESEKNLFKSRDTDFDITVCVLLDGKVDTAIAAAAFFSGELVDTDIFVEVGLWRDRFKSAFSRFMPVSDTYELAHLPMSGYDLQQIEAFLTELRGSTKTRGLTTVIGEEMIDVASSKALSNIIHKQFSRVQLVVFGQSDLSLSACWSGLSQFVERSTQCSFFIGADLLVNKSALLDKLAGVRQFYLPPYMKHSLLIAEKKGVAFEKLRALAPQIIPDL